MKLSASALRYWLQPLPRIQEGGWLLVVNQPFGKGYGSKCYPLENIVRSNEHGDFWSYKTYKRQQFYRINGGLPHWKVLKVMWCARSLQVYIDLGKGSKEKSFELGIRFPQQIYSLDG